MAGNSGDFEFAFERALVQRFDVLDHMLDLEAAHIDLFMRKRVKHEGIVGIGAVANSDNFFILGFHRWEL